MGELPSPQGPVSAHVVSPAHPLVPRWWSLESLLPRMGNAEPASLAVSLVPSNLQTKRWARVCEGGCAREVRGCDHGPEGVWAVAGARCGGDPHRGAQWSVRTQPVSALKRKRCRDGSRLSRPFGRLARVARGAASPRGPVRHAAVVNVPNTARFARNESSAALQYAIP